MSPPKAADEIDFDFDITDPPVCPPSTESMCDSIGDMNTHDVLYGRGRGGSIYSRVGNRRFRKLVQDFQPTYLSARRREKPLLARTIVLIIRKRGGRFLKMDDDSGEMLEGGDVKAEAKTLKTLNDKLKYARQRLMLPQQENEDQDQDIPATKKARYQLPLLATAPAETTTVDNNTAASHDGAVALLPAPAAARASTTAFTTATREPPYRRGTALQEDTLTRAVVNQGTYKRDWDAIAALMPGRTREECCSEWHNGLDPSVDRTRGRALVPGQTQAECSSRYHDGLDPSVDRTPDRIGKWTCERRQPVERCDTKPRRQ
jgi:hypothetical protein